MSQEYPATTLLLIRHAQARAAGSSHYGPDTLIGQLGRLQVAALVSKLVAAVPPAVVYTSPLPRAVQTASPVCERLGLEAVLDPRLTEFELGKQEIEIILERPDLLIWHPDHRAADGEILREFSARVAAFCDEVVERHPGERVAVVSHAGTIDATLRWSLGTTPASPWQHEFEVANASITELEVWPRGRIRGGASRYTVLRRVGDVTHLDGIVSEI
jgi:2,3-bisphosphoglycerate-dependent phosphoglycerate mutase